MLMMLMPPNDDGDGGALFDFCVRPADKPPPWPMPILRLPGGRASISFQLILQTTLFLSFFLVGFRLSYPHNLVAFLVYVVVVSNFVIVPVDGLASNALGRNVVNLRRAGYSDVTILAFLNFNAWASQLIGFVVANFVCTDDEIFTLEFYMDLFAQPHKVGIMALRIFASLAVAEVLFVTSHSLLHTNKRLSDVHVFHHYCTFPCYTANLLFHPIDLLIEFSGPALSLFALHFGVFQDQATFLVTYIVFQLWYSYDHEEYLNTYHAEHHRTCNSVYAIYTNVKGDAKANFLRERIRKTVPTLEWPALKEKKV